MKILFATAEVSPFSKVGGLADVASSLPKALRRLGHDVRVVTPLHLKPEDNAPKTEGEPFALPLTWAGQEVQPLVRRATSGEGPVYLVDYASYFQRRAIYGEPDDLDRYLFFCQASLALPKALNWQPDILHCHDWHAAALPFGLRNYAWEDPFYHPTASVLTIHNLRYRGPHKLVDMLCQAIFYANVISTVSPTYAQEILTPEYGEGLHTILALRRDRLFGILNGIDYEEFDPATDPHIPAHYDAAAPEKKAFNKAALQERGSLTLDPSIPLVGIISRLTEQKGFDLVEQVIESFLENGRFQFFLLATGEQRYETFFKELPRRYPGRAAVFLTFDAALAQLIYAGSDFFLMPSRFEPCGLGQMISLRYGTIPVVRRTGGLADTIQDCAPDLSTGNGFSFTEYSAWALREAMERALAAYQQREAWRELVVRAMKQDFSWEASARKYVEMYEAAVAGRG
ncbi:MAG: glycogen/starch synthase [Dehalococcoidia bacterium]|nr:glycogen/starch synthase [Dehalococcoidia bacterium]